MINWVVDSLWKIKSYLHRPDVLSFYLRTQRCHFFGQWSREFKHELGKMIKYRNYLTSKDYTNLGLIFLSHPRSSWCLLHNNFKNTFMVLLCLSIIGVTEFSHDQCFTQFFSNIQELIYSHININVFFTGHGRYEATSSNLLHKEFIFSFL